MPHKCKTLCLVLGDQLSPELSSLQSLDKQHDVILVCEVYEETQYTKHHPKKIAFLFSAMRHFAEDLRQQGFNVRYVCLDDVQNRGSFDGEVERAIEDLKPERLVVTEAGEWRVQQKFLKWQKDFTIPVEILDDTRFLCSHDFFRHWAKGKKSLRMEFFYREMRKKYHILIDEKMNPVGGQWNYDAENRKPPKTGMTSPKRISHKKDAITRTVLKLVEEKFSSHFGDLYPFHFAVTREQAEKEAQDFIKNILPYFGDYQDAMVAGEAYLYHSLLSSYINAGLLNPLSICQQAEQAYYDGHVPLNAAEGFIRQILGWREYVRGLYWYYMPDYAEMNFFEALRPLPEFYWGAKTGMFCVSEAVSHTRIHAYSHHIQRLMITGNFALLAGLDVKQVCDWYLAVYADAFEWVELPNTLGMALFGDGGIMASKPYAASGKYINRMSNYCSKCVYNPNDMIGDKACPFNALYWNFLHKHQDKLRGNQRMTYIYATWDKMAADKRQDILEKAEKTLEKMQQGTL